MRTSRLCADRAGHRVVPRWAAAGVALGVLGAGSPGCVHVPSGEDALRHRTVEVTPADDPIAVAPLRVEAQER